MDFTFHPVRAVVAFFLGNSLGTGDEGADFLGIVANLQTVVVDDDRPFQDGGIFQNESNEFRNGHLVEIDSRFLEDLAATGNDIVGSVFAFGNGFLHRIISQRIGKDVHRLVRDLVFVEPFFDFAARCTAWGNQDFNHEHILHKRALVFKRCLW